MPQEIRKQALTRRYLPSILPRSLSLHRYICTLFLILAVLISGQPLLAQRAKAAKKVGGSPRVNREKRTQVTEARQRTVREANQGREKARREAGTNPRIDRNVRREGETRKEHEPRRALPIIEGQRREPEVKRAPERELRERFRSNPARHKRVPEEAHERVRNTLERFRRNWVNGDSRALTGLLSGKARVKLTIESKDINDSFGRGQAQYVLKEYLSSADIRELSFSRFRVSASDGMSAYGVGKLQMRDRKTGKIMDHTVFVAMAREGEGWAVREIRITEEAFSTAFRKFGEVFERETQYFHRGTAPLALPKAPTGRFRYLYPLGEPAVAPRTPRGRGPSGQRYVTEIVSRPT